MSGGSPAEGEGDWFLNTGHNSIFIMKKSQYLSTYLLNIRIIRDIIYICYYYLCNKGT